MILHVLRVNHTLLKNILNIDNLRSRSIVDLSHTIYGPADFHVSQPIIILHDLLGSKQQWNLMSSKIQIATNKTVIAVDARNHGESRHHKSHTYNEMAMDIVELMSNLNILKATFIGHGMGGRTAIVLALMKPSRVKALIVVDITPLSSTIQMNFFALKIIDVMKSIKFGTNDLTVARGVALFKLTSSQLIEDIETLDSLLLNVGLKDDQTIGWTCAIDVLKANFSDITSFPLEMTERQYMGPSLFISGEKSKIIPPMNSKEIRNCFPKAGLTKIEGPGHKVYIPTEKAIDKSFLSVVTNFVYTHKL